MTAAVIAAEAVMVTPFLIRSLSRHRLFRVRFRVGPLEVYIGGVELSGHAVPDKGLIEPAVAALNATGTGPLAAAAVCPGGGGSAVACGYVNYYCHGKRHHRNDSSES